MITTTRAMSQTMARIIITLQRINQWENLIKISNNMHAVTYFKNIVSQKQMYFIILCYLRKTPISKHKFTIHFTKILFVNELKFSTHCHSVNYLHQTVCGRKHWYLRSTLECHITVMTRCWPQKQIRTRFQENIKTYCKLSTYII